MIKPYGVVGLVPTIWGTSCRADIMKNISHLEELTSGALWLSSLDIPVRLLVLPEGALQGFNDEALDVDIQEFLDDGAIDIPGPETDRLGELAKKTKTDLDERIVEGIQIIPEPLYFFGALFLLYLSATHLIFSDLKYLALPL